MKTVVVILLVIGLGAGGYFYYVTQVAAEPATSFRTATVKRGDLASTISATGTIEPVEVVDVGAQVVGPILDLGVDPADLKGRDPLKIPPDELKKLKRIDYGSTVHDGTVLATIDAAVYKAQVDSAEAALVRAKADLKQYQAKLLQATQDWKRAEQLHTIKLDGPNKSEEVKGISDADYDLAQANFETAKASVGVAEAAIRQADASLQLAKTNLNYTVIKSPVEGVIVDRRVNVGQTVVATFSAASLFLIAKDLSKMQVWASVNEADIGRIRSRKNMPVRFTVDAYPNDVFRGKVSQIRLNATMTQNVVTYTVVVDFDNADLKLMPYLTANLLFEVDKRPKVLLAPNAALRWKPRLDQVAPEARDSVASMLAGRKGGQTRGGAASTAPPKEKDDHGHLWVKEGEFLRPIDVKVGLTDGTMTEVASNDPKADDVKDGLEVVTGEARAEARGGGETTNPFAPKLFRGGSQKEKTQQ